MTDATAQPPGHAAPAASTPPQHAGEPGDPRGQIRPRDELVVFLTICVVLFPAITIALMGTYGLIVWISHMLAA